MPGALQKARLFKPLFVPEVLPLPAAFLKYSTFLGVSLSGISGFRNIGNASKAEVRKPKAPSALASSVDLDVIPKVFLSTRSIFLRRYAIIIEVAPKRRPLIRVCPVQSLVLHTISRNL